MRGPARVLGELPEENDDYLQLRKDALRIPKQFYFKVKGGAEENEGMDNYFSFNAVTEEGKDGPASPDKDKNSSLGGHPLVPRLNLPRQDPNEEWREIMAQQQSYEDVSSSSQQQDPSSSQQ